MQPDLAITAAQTNIHQVYAARLYKTKNWSALETKELPRKKALLIRIQTENGEHIMDQKNGLPAKISKEEIRISVMMDFPEILPYLIRIFHQGQTSHVGKTFRGLGDHMINAKTSHSIEAMEMQLSTIRMKTGETVETFLVLHRLQGDTSPKIFHTTNQELINLTTLPSTDLTTNLRLVLHLTNKRSHKAVIRHHLMWFASPQPTIPLMNHQIFAR